MRRDGEDDIIRRIKVDPHTFDSILEPKIFSDWVADLDYYFNWYRFTEESRVGLIGRCFQGQLGFIGLR